MQIVGKVLFSALRTPALYGGCWLDNRGIEYVFRFPDFPVGMYGRGGFCYRRLFNKTCVR